ncbi:tyrosinase family oxidase copper chaperone [Streptomyces sp. NPDC005492]|uniref:tyrosinase family oxidase copper chaperone n=1 Tax=Streptomyces sp. NPDC005492 TaxID=3156883 RepID=UPI0033AA71DF
MSVSVGGAPVGGESLSPVRTGSVRGTRREAVRGAFGALLAVALVPVVAASRPTRSGEDPGDTAFDETYRGRRIQGVLTDGWQVTVDGRPLHLMRRADGTWLSMVDHYRSYPTALEATRAAVDELSPGSELSEADGTMDMPMGGDHGVHA